MKKKTFAGESSRLLQLQDAEKPALITETSTITFGRLRDGIASTTQKLLAAGVKPKDRVAVSFPNSKEVLYLAFALSDIGATIVPLHPSTPPAFVTRILGFLRVSHFIVPRESSLLRLELPCPVMSMDQLLQMTGNVSSPPAPEPDDLAVLITTSGTTADPKFVPISQENCATIIDATRVILAPMADFEKQLSFIMVFPLSSSGILPTMAQLALGGTYVLTDDVSPHNFLSLIQKHKLDGMQGPPSYLEALTRFPVDKFDVSSITRLNSGSDFVPNKLLFALKQKFKNLAHVGIGYGLAETSSIVATWNAHTETDFKIPTNQYRLCNPDDNEFKINNEDGPAPVGEKGEICIRGKSVIAGYYQNPELTAQVFDSDGWLHTGDVGSLDESGALIMQGREKFTIKRGGRSISPKSVELALEEHPHVSRAVVVGVPQQLFGEMIWAFVTPAPGSNPTVGDINAFCRDTLPAYLKPDNVAFMDQMPRTRGVGKIDYAQLKQIGIRKLNEMTGENNG